MSKDPAVLFYTSDFLTGTAFFTDEQRGQYIRLLCEQHQNGHIPENHMLTICLSLGSPVVKKFVRDAAGNFYNERMETEIQKRANFINSRRDNGLLGGRPKKPKAKPSDEPNGEATENLRGNGNTTYEVLFNKVITENNIELSNEIKSLFLEWLKYKSEKRQTYKETGLKSFLIKSMNECGGDPEVLREMILYSTAQNYDGLFKEKKYGSNKKDNGATAEQILAAVNEHFPIEGFPGKR